MLVNKILLSLSLFTYFISFSQESPTNLININRHASAIDSIEDSKTNIVHFIVRKYMHNQDKLEVHYIIDTLNKILLKCIHESRSEEYRSTYVQKATFYFINNKMVKLFFEDFKDSIQVFSYSIYFDSSENKFNQDNLIPPNILNRWDATQIRGNIKRIST
jgi:hypothetical protein